MYSISLSAWLVRLALNTPMRVISHISTIAGELALSCSNRGFSPLRQTPLKPSSLRATVCSFGSTTELSRGSLPWDTGCPLYIPNFLRVGYEVTKDRTGDIFLPRSTMKLKVWYKSTQLWFNILTFVVIAATHFLGYSPDPEFATNVDTLIVGFSPLINVLLRLKTNSGIVYTKDGEVTE